MTKVLSRDAIQRMISQRGGTTTVSGGGGEGGVSAAWIEGNYVAKNYWDQIFTVHGKRVVTVTDGTTGEKTVTEEELTLPPNMLPSSQTVTDEETGDVTVTEVKIVSLQVNAGIWTNSFVSALGLNPEGGGGGGADLGALLASINTSAIGSVAPGASNVGKCLVWTADGWAWGTTGSSGGGTVTAITAGTGLSGGTITASGTIAISSTYQGYISHGETAYGWGNHADAGYATQQWVNQQGFLTSSAISDMATQTWVGERYLSIDFFSSLFKAYTNEGVEVTPNNGNVSTIENIKAMFGFWTEQYVSALGKNSDGSGGLNALLQSLNESTIGSVAPTTAQIGKCLVWTANGWAWGTTGGGGGGGTVTSITAGTGLSGGTITTSGTIAISTEYQTRISNGQTAYGWGNHAEAGYAKASDLSDYLPLSGGTLTGALHMGSTAGASPFIYWGDGTYAYIGEDADDHITLRGDKGVNILTGSTYALSWNGDKLATQAWVENQGFVKSSGVTSVGLSVPTGFTVSGSPVTTSGTLALGIASGYFMPTTTQRSTWNGKQDAISDLATIRSNASHGETAYGWGNHANAGYMLRTEGMRFTSYGNYIAARFVTATGAYDTERAANAQGDGYIEWWSSGGYFNHQMGWIRAKGNVEVGTSATDTAHYLQIGGARLYWDNANNALKLIKADGTACNFLATGGVTALQTS